MENIKPDSRQKAGLASRALARCALGALFLLNPNINIVDIIPDAIGYLLILSGLGVLEPLSPSIEESKRRFTALLRISVIRIAALPLVFSIGYTEKTFILIFTFTFALLETIYLLPAFHYFFDGASYLSLRYGSKEEKPKLPRILVKICADKQGDKKVRPRFKSIICAAGRVFTIKRKAPRIITAVFAIGRGALNVLPELQYLPAQYDDDYGLNPSYQPFKLAQLSHMLLLFNIVFTLIIAVFWFIRFRRYLKNLRRDFVLDNSLSAELAGRQNDDGAMLLGRLKPAFALFSAAMFTRLDLYADGYNLLPDIISALLLLAAILYIYKIEKNKSLLLATASIYTVLAFIISIINYIFAKNHYAFAAVLRRDALRMQTVQTVFIFISSFVFAALMYLLCLTLSRIAKQHAGLFAEPEFRTKNAKTQRDRLRVRNMIWGCFALSIATEIMSAAYGALFIKHSFLWMPAAILSIALGVLASVTTSNLYYQIELRHGKNF